MRGDGRVKVLCYHYGLQTCESCKGKGRGDGRVKVLCYHYGLQTCESCKGKGRGDEGRWSCESIVLSLWTADI